MKEIPGLDVEWFLAIPVRYEPSPPPRPHLRCKYPDCTGCGHSGYNLTGDRCTEVYWDEARGPVVCAHYCASDRAIQAWKHDRA